ncbi:RecA family ATPase Rhp55 [Schizosaccharomyces cryophilus OY26]|uniref:RecA family ATPase Rhp55 n=1 Tax=Schizosaccharomyces cryophilus (strain OY26 / ATCC MYA-4695 / CBS 11777 / NBRC 106824 / NRRL Y48691) TaxID=653667 RepID=S9XD07_SCHCR|nr:RecA family ATPase Rhp55 [Schizosaccharomyces cryophilus OY26]EPY51721.1 RecA family ATPase Rhp55 [Schizosaccharomyces cryophilus OY26]
MISSQHRLSTQPAIRAYEAFSAPGFSFNSKFLNEAFGGTGLKRGFVSEICGAPGMGKTSLSLALTANALLSGTRVLWIETCHPIPLSRLRALLQSQVPSSQEEDNLSSTLDEYLQLLDVYYAPYLANLLVYLKSFDDDSNLDDVGLIIIDNLSMPIQLAFPTCPDDYAYLRQRRNTSSRKTSMDSLGKENMNSGIEKEVASKELDEPFPNSQTNLNKRKRVVGEISSILSRIAATYQIAILVTTQMTSKVVTGMGAKLIPFLSNNWLDKVSSRLVLYCRHPTENDKFVDNSESNLSYQSLRYAYMAKQLPGISIDSELVFQVTENGLMDCRSLPINSSQRRKRSLMETDL